MDSTQQTTIYTRKQYMAGECDSAAYYRQFVTPGVIEHVLACIGKKDILASQDEHLNDIPLKRWDAMSDSIRRAMNQEAKRLAEPGQHPRSFMWSLSDAVCIAKQAARMIQEGAGK